MRLKFLEDGRIFMKLTYLSNGVLETIEKLFANKQEYDNFIATFSF